MTVAPHIEDDILIVTDENFADLLLESAQQARVIDRGEMQPARILAFPFAHRRLHHHRQCLIPDASAGCERGWEFRNRCSRALNVSDKTVKAWEQGKNPPKGATLRLLEIIEKRPTMIFPRVPGRHKVGE